MNEWCYNYTDYLSHHGILGMKWGVRRYQNENGTLTPAGKKRYGDGTSSVVSDKDMSSKIPLTQTRYKGIGKTNNELLTLSNEDLEELIKHRELVRRLRETDDKIIDKTTHEKVFNAIAKEGVTLAAALGAGALVLSKGKPLVEAGKKGFTKLGSVIDKIKTS